MKLWKVAPLDKNEANAIQNQYHLPGIIAMLLQIRGITTAQEIEDFLHNDTEIEPPWDIKDMEKAAERISRAVESGIAQACDMVTALLKEGVK